ADRLRDEYERAKSLVETRAISRQEFVGKELLYQRALHDVRRAEAEHRLLLAGAWEPDKQIARATVADARAERDRIATEIERATTPSVWTSACYKHCTKSTRRQRRCTWASSWISLSKPSQHRKTGRAMDHP